MATSNRLFVQVLWGQSGTFIRSFGAEEGPLHAEANDAAEIPLYGSPQAEAGFTLAEPHADGFRIYVPEGARLQRSVKGDLLTDLPVTERSIELRLGERARLTIGKSVIVASVEAPPAAISRNYRRAVLPVLALIVTFVFPIYFLLANHSEKDSRRLAAKELWRAAQRGMPELIRPGEQPTPAASSEQAADSAP